MTCKNLDDVARGKTRKVFAFLNFDNNQSLYLHFSVVEDCRDIIYQPRRRP